MKIDMEPGISEKPFLENSSFIDDSIEIQT